MGAPPVLLERDDEVEELRTWIRSAGQGRGGAALITGEAGIGKTALLGEACRQARTSGMAVLFGRGGELEGEFAWGVVRQLFETTVYEAGNESSSDLLRGAAGLARPALGVDMAFPSVDPSYATLHGLYWLCVNLSRRGPLLLAVDDAHWADVPSLRFVSHLVPRLGELPILVLLTSRPVSAEPAPVETMLARLAAEGGLSTQRPAALSEAGSASLIRSALGRDAAAEFCHTCHEVTRGNPFLLQALLTELSEAKVPPTAVGVAHAQRMTPAAVSASVLVRLARLSVGALELARAVAVLGTSVEPRQAGSLAGLDPDETAASVEALMRTGVLEGDRTLSFVHPLVRSAVYGDLSAPARSQRHRRAAQMLADEHAPHHLIAPHLVESLPNADGWTVERLRQAAADAASRGAAEIAADYLRRALSEPPADEVRSQVLFELGQIEARQDPLAALPHLEEARAGAGHSTLRAAATLALGEALTLAGRLGQAVEVLSQGIAEVGDEESDVRASLAAALLSAARWEPGAQATRHALVDQLNERAVRGEHLDPRLHWQLAIETTARGIDREKALDHARRTLDAASPLSTTSALLFPEAMLVLVFADEVAEAEQGMKDWLAIVQERAWPLGVSMALTCASLAALYRGSVGEAVASARGAVVGHAEIRMAPITVAFLVEALIERGEVALAFEELAERGLEGELPLTWATTPLLLARGRLHAAAGDHRSAVADLLAVGRRCEAWEVTNPAMVPWRSSAAISLDRLGERRRAITLADEEVELAHRWGAPRALGVALRAAGIARGGPAGIELLRTAASALETSVAHLEHARALSDLGSALRRDGQRAEARRQLSRGFDLAHHLGGMALAKRAREELAIAGARPRRTSFRGRDALTPSELRVTQLAAKGRTNREIAEALFLTQRTVETHLTSSYAKLGVASRRQLASALEPPGSLN